MPKLKIGTRGSPLALYQARETRSRLMAAHGLGEDEVEIYVDGIRCASCVWVNERILLRTPGVLAARLNYATHRARIRWNPARVDLAAVLSRIRAAG